MGKDLKIVYTPLHGTGNIPVQRVLKELGFEKFLLFQNKNYQMEASQQLIIQTQKI